MAAGKQLLEALAVTAELTGTELSAHAARVMASDLEQYPQDQVIGALVRCRKELKGRLTIADVLARLEDGRPGPEEAWAMLPKDEFASACWTDEMRESAAVCNALLREGEHVQARMAFLEKYKTLVQRARDARKPVAWTFTLGLDKSGREAAITEAVEKKRIAAHSALTLLPYYREGGDDLPDRLLALAGDGDVKALPAPAVTPMPQAVREKWNALKAKMENSQPRERRRRATG